MGIEFLDPKTLRQREVFAAAAAFCRQEPLYTIAEEAFDTDPQTPRDELFAGGIRVIARFGPMDVRREKSLARRPRRQLCSLRTTKLARWAAALRSRPLRRWTRWSVGSSVRWPTPGSRQSSRKRQPSARGRATTAPSASSLPSGEPKAFAEALVEKFPALSTRAQEFAKSDELTDMPSLRYQALLRAGLATMPASRPARRWLRH